MMNQEIRATTMSLEEVSMGNAFKLIGEPDNLVVGIYLLFTGQVEGHIMLAFRPATAFEFVDMAMGLPDGSTQNMGEMEKSVLAEMGNIVGSFFLNAVADDMGICLLPTPPAVIMDMAGAIIGSVMAEVWNANDSAFVMRLVFSTADRQIEGSFIVLPSFSPVEPEPGRSEAVTR